jgi:hypothetical protein
MRSPAFSPEQFGVDQRCQKAFDCPCEFIPVIGVVRLQQLATDQEVGHFYKRHLNCKHDVAGGHTLPISFHTGGGTASGGHYASHSTWQRG